MTNPLIPDLLNAGIPLNIISTPLADMHSLLMTPTAAVPSLCSVPSTDPLLLMNFSPMPVPSTAYLPSYQSTNYGQMNNNGYDPNQQFQEFNDFNGGTNGLLLHQQQQQQHQPQLNENENINKSPKSGRSRVRGGRRNFGNNSYGGRGRTNNCALPPRLQAQRMNNNSYGGRGRTNNCALPPRLQAQRMNN
eukprot:534500_1